MDKQEALAVMREILGVLGESVLISDVSIDPLNSQISKDPDKDGYIIRIKCDLDNYSQKCLNPLLEKHELSMKEGYIVIFPC